MIHSSSIKVLVTGSLGQLGSELRDVAEQYPQFDFIFVDVNELDLTASGKVRDFITRNSFRAIINCAAYTAVDTAEDQEGLAMAVNAEAVRTIAEVCRENRIRLMHISTDYVFDGENNQPLDERAETHPLSVYGITKLKGEQYVQSILDDAYIIRTAWVYSSYGKNFVKTINTLARQRPELGVVVDQIGAPTYAHDLALAILEILSQVFSGKKDVPGVYHYTNEGAISWYDLAHFIVRHAGLSCHVKPIRSEEYKTKAARPKFSLLSKRKIKETFGIDIPHWHDSLLRCLERM
jgi:dTDP-4-dehydrorhamnose reductase